MRADVGELKNSKTPGEDRIQDEHLKTRITQLLKPITIIFNIILQTEELSEQWKISKHHTKKGVKDDLNNYRPINLMSNMYKCFPK